jgi:nanoRNase/pAp phosphatase (c-di-AMP/oligoRNAs hydrolase)
VFDYYGGYDAFPKRWEDMMEAVDKGDSADFTEDEVLNPEGWVLLNFIMDARTGLGRFREFRISNYQLMMQLIDYCRNHSIEEILELPDVKERTQLYFEHDSKARQQIQKCATVHGNVVVLDLRDQDPIYATNRFTLYALYPKCNMSIHVLWGLKKQNTVFAIGKSILNKTSNTNVGELCLQYNGGGHLNAGTCQVDNDKAEEVLKELIAKINQDG